MWRDGNEAAGYEVSVDTTKRVLRLDCWGLWSLALAESYAKSMNAAYDKLRGRPWYVLAIIAKFPAQRQEVAEIHGALMASAAAAGMKRAASVVDSSMTQMQIKRLAEESRMPELAFYKSEADGLRWLLHDA
jgi:hypothetical protein